MLNVTLEALGRARALGWTASALGLEVGMEDQVGEAALAKGEGLVEAGRTGGVKREGGEGVPTREPGNVRPR